MILATVSTGHYEWTVLADSEEAANSALLAAYETHVTQMLGMAHPDVMAELIAGGEVDYLPAQPGVVLRDGSPIEGAANRAG